MSYASVVSQVFGSLKGAQLTASVRVRRWTLDHNQDRNEVDGSPWSVDVVWEPAKPGAALSADVLAKPEDRIVYVPALSCPFAPLKAGDRVEFPTIDDPTDDEDYESRTVVSVSSLAMGSTTVLYTLGVQ